MHTIVEVGTSSEVQYPAVLVHLLCVLQLLWCHERHMNDVLGHSFSPYSSCASTLPLPMQEESGSDGEGWGGDSDGFGHTREAQPLLQPLLQPEDRSSALHTRPSPAEQCRQPQQHQQHQHQQAGASAAALAPTVPRRQQFAPLAFDAGSLRAASDADFHLTEASAVSAGSSFASLGGPTPAAEAEHGLYAHEAALPAVASMSSPAAAAGPAGPAGLPPLRLGRLSVPSSPRPAAATAAVPEPQSARGTPRASLGAALAAEVGSTALLSSPRTMHGLVRGRLLPAAADRQAVMQVGEMMSDDEPAASPSSAPGSAVGSPSAAATAPAQLPPPATLQPGPSGSLSAPSFSWQQLPPAGSRGASRLLHSSTSDVGGGSGKWGRRSLDGGGSGTAAAATAAVPAAPRRGFTGLGAAGSSGLAALLRPPSPGKISPLASAGNSPEPADGNEEEEGAVAQAVGASAQQQQQQLLLLPELPPLPAPLEAADGTAATPTAAAELAAEPAAAPPAPPAAMHHAPQDSKGSSISINGSAPPPPAIGRSVSLNVPSAGPLPPSPFVRPVTTAGAAALPAPPHQHRAEELSPLTALPGAVLPLTASASRALGSIKPWQTGALLLRRSMSTPLTGIAEQLEGQAGGKDGTGAPSSPPAGGGPASGGGGGSPLPCAAGGATSAGAGTGQWSEEVLAEARMRLVAGGMGARRLGCGARGIERRSLPCIYCADSTAAIPVPFHHSHGMHATAFSALKC